MVTRILITNQHMFFGGTEFPTSNKDGHEEEFKHSSISSYNGKDNIIL